MLGLPLRSTRMAASIFQAAHGLHDVHACMIPPLQPCMVHLSAGPVSHHIISVIHASYRPLGATTLTFGTFLQARAIRMDDACLSTSTVTCASNACPAQSHHLHACTCDAHVWVHCMRHADFTHAFHVNCRQWQRSVQRHASHQTPCLQPSQP